MGGSTLTFILLNSFKLENNMTAEQTINLKEGDVVYIVAMSHKYSLNNPFVRTCKSGKSDYFKPLGIFQTTVSEIKEKTNTAGSWYVSGRFDTTPMEHIIWRGRCDDVPKDKKVTDFVGYEYAYEEYYANYLNAFKDNFNTENVFFTEEEAKEFYDKSLKKFRKNMKQYAARLQNEIDRAYRYIKEAENEIENINDSL